MANQVGGRVKVRATAIGCESRRLVNYVSFPYGDLVKQILAGMDW